MDNFVKSLQDVFIARVKNMLLLNFIIAWAIVNHEVVMYVLFDNMSIDNKILYLRHITIGVKEGFVYPILITAFYIYFIPLLNLLFVIPYNRYVDKRIKEHKNEMLKEHYERQEEVERIRLEKTEFLKDTMKIELEKKVLQLQEDRNNALQKENDLKAKDLELQNKKNETLKEENDLKAKEIELKKSEEILSIKLKKENNSLKEENSILEKEIDEKINELKKLDKNIKAETLKAYLNNSAFTSQFPEEYLNLNKKISDMTAKELATMNIDGLTPVNESKLAQFYLDDLYRAKKKDLASFDLDKNTQPDFKDASFDLEDKSKKDS